MTLGDPYYAWGKSRHNCTLHESVMITPGALRKISLRNASYPIKRDHAPIGFTLTYKRDVRIRGFFASPNSDVALLFHALFRVFFVVVFVVVIVIIAAAFFVVAAAAIADANAAAGGRGRFGGRRFDAEMSVLFGSGRRRG